MEVTQQLIFSIVCRKSKIVLLYNEVTFSVRSDRIC
jgi:hypothetical protein